jgi:hypothetical protein
MALGTKQSEGKKVYLSVVGGKLTQRCEESTPGAVKRVNKMGKEVYELHHNFVSGMMTGIALRESAEFGDSYEVFLEEVGEVYVINIPISGRVSNGILSRLPNIDLTSPVEIRTFMITDKESGKEKSFSSVYQNGLKIEPAFTREKPNGLPPLEQKKVKGQLVWDDSEQIEFYKELVKKTFSSRPAPAVMSMPVTEIAAEVDADDLPF